ncbi:MAG TPA: sialidase family protein [Acidimicrobiales bacterium]|nr:sialidase family protein [Acidimicrobiales bacterium]
MARTTRRLAALAAGLTILASGGAFAADPPVLTTPVHVTKEDVNPVRTYSAPNLVAHPDDPDVVVGAFADLRTRRCGLVRTVDAGQTWKILESSPSPSSYPSCNSNPRGSFQGMLAFGRDGALYYGLDGWDTQDGGIGGNVSMVVSKSTDLGDNWQPVIARDARGKTGEAQESYRPITGFAVDRETGGQDTVYIGSGRRQPGFSGPNALPVQPVVAVSTDGGRTFGEPVNLAESAFNDPAMRQNAFRSTTTVAAGATTTSTTTPPPGSRAANPDQAANFGGFGPSITVDDKGTVYAIWPATYANLNPRPANGIMLSRSDDKGRTWTTFPVTPFDFRYGSFTTVVWSPEGGEQGTLHAVTDGYENPSITGYQDIYYYRSTDGGRTWSERRNVTDDDPKDLFSQYYPNIAVAPDGRVEIAFWDTRNDPGYRSNDVYMTTSTDNGVTWSKNLRVTDQSIDRRIGVWSTNFDITSPPGLAPAKAYTMLAWDDTRNTDRTAPDATSLGGGLQDIYVAAVQYEALGGGTSNAAKVALAGVVGLLVVGLVLVLASRFTRNQGDGSAGPSERRAAPAKAEVG